MAKFRIETTRGVVFHTDSGRAELKWNVGFSAKWEGKCTKAQEHLESEILRTCEPYIPLQTSMLVKSGTLGTEIGSGEVKWIAPYAKFQYYGKVMIGKESRSAWAKPGEEKEVTDKNLTYHGGGQRGAFWFERAKEVHLAEWEEGVQEKLAGK